MFLQILSSQQVYEFLICILYVPLLIKHERDQQDACCKYPPGWSSQTLTVNIDSHPAGHNCIADRTENEQHPSKQRTDFYGLLDLLILINDRYSSGNGSGRLNSYWIFAWFSIISIRTNSFPDPIVMILNDLNTFGWVIAFWTVIFDVIILV